MKKNVAIFGDSILRPIIINDNKYVVSDEVDWTAIEKKLNITIDNRSRMGATVKHGLGYLTEYLDNNTVDTVLIEYGGNDCNYDWREVSEHPEQTHLPHTSPTEFSTTLNTMLDLLQSRNIKPILMTLPPISSNKFFSWLTYKGFDGDNILHHLRDVEVITRHQEYYSNMVAKIAAKRNLTLVDVRQDFLLCKQYNTLICCDGLHPTPAGGQLIADAFIAAFS